MSQILLSPLSHFLFSPMAWGLLLALLLLLTWRRLTRRWRVAGSLVGLALLLLCTPLGANALIGMVESRIPAHAQCDRASRAPIVVLSGGFEREPRTIDDYAALTPESWRRLRAAVDAWRGDRGDRGSSGSAFWIAGGGPHALKESAMQARLAHDWGVPVDALRIETRSMTTWESAVQLRGSLPAQIRLASSAWHLPRALIAFRAAGFRPCLQVTDSQYLPPDGLGYFLPQVSAMEKTEVAAYEAIGTLYYYIRVMRAHRRDAPAAPT